MLTSWGVSDNDECSRMKLLPGLMGFSTRKPDDCSGIVGFNSQEWCSRGRSDTLRLRRSPHEHRFDCNEFLRLIDLRMEEQMSYQGYSPRPDGQQKAMKYCLTIAVATFALIFIVGIIAAIPRKTKEWREEKNQKAMYELFHK